MARPITKAELISAIAKKTGAPKGQTAEFLQATIDVITEQLVAGNAVALPGLAKFEARDRPARQVRNVATGAIIDKEADRAVKISAQTALKAAVNA